MAVRTSTPLQSSEDPYPLYSTIRTDPVTGTKATVRNVAVSKWIDAYITIQFGEIIDNKMQTN